MSTAVLTRPAVTEPGAAPLLPVVGAGLAVPLVTGGTVPYAQLDTAASTPALAAVADRVAEALPLYASVHRGAGYLSQVSTALYESARDRIAAFVGARDDDVCVVTRNTTDALGLLAGCVPPGGGVLVLDAEHHADLLPWQRRGDATVLATPPTVAATLAALAAELAGAGTRCSPSPAPPTSPARRCRCPRSSRSRTRPARGSSSTGPSWSRTGGSPWPRRARTGWPSPATSSTPPTAPARSSAGGTGSTPARRTWPAGERWPR